LRRLPYFRPNVLPENIKALPDLYNGMEWVNITYNDPARRRMIDGICGRPFGLWEMIRRGGVGTPRLQLVEATMGLLAPFDRTEDRRYCSMEARSEGILLRCRSRLETMGLPIPYSGLGEVVMGTPGAVGFGELHLRMDAGPTLLIHVPRDHWTTVAHLLRRSLPEGRFRTRASVA
jgi:hypothetical protein